VIMLVSKDVYVLINYTSFVESVFMALSVIGLFVLRYTQPTLYRPIKVLLIALRSCCTGKQVKVRKVSK